PSLSLLRCPALGRGYLPYTTLFRSGPGGFYVESRNEGPSVTRLGIIGYDSHAKVYTSYYANNVGMVGVGTGTVNGNTWTWMVEEDLKSTRLNSSHVSISYAVFCLKK